MGGWGDGAMGGWGDYEKSALHTFSCVSLLPCQVLNVTLAKWYDADFSKLDIKNLFHYFKLDTPLQFCTKLAMSVH